eukprot:scaffold502_cov350-Pavlova_lutheri.AAC.10
MGWSCFAWFGKTPFEGIDKACKRGHYHDPHEYSDHLHDGRWTIGKAPLPPPDSFEVIGVSC